MPTWAHIVQLQKPPDPPPKPDFTQAQIDKIQADIRKFYVDKNFVVEDVRMSPWSRIRTVTSLAMSNP
jgi:hypothetical protein